MTVVFGIHCSIFIDLLILLKIWRSNVFFLFYKTKFACLKNQACILFSVIDDARDNLLGEIKIKELGFFPNVTGSAIKECLNTNRKDP